MREIIFQAFVYILQAIILIIGGYIVAYLKSKLGKAKYELLKKRVQDIVNAVEQLVGAGNGEIKKQKAMEMAKKLFGNKLSDDEIEVLIEAVVREINLIAKQ